MKFQVVFLGQEEGQITNIPLFPNPAKKKIGGHAIITIENIDFSNDTIYATIFNSEADKNKSFSLEQMPLRYVVEEALERYGGDLIKSEKCSKYETINVNSVDALTSLENYRTILKYLCQSNIAIFDVTGFEPVVMFLLGIRSVVKRGLTLISVGDEYKLGDFIELPFNIKEVNLISHSNSQVDFGDPINLAGTKIKEGFKELVEYPDYLDLPTYDAIRSNIDIVGSGTRKVSENQVLVLCPFNEEYQKGNWKLILKPNIETVIKKRTGQSPEIVRTLDMRSPRLVSQTLYQAIRYTPMCIVDWSYWRPNVFFEFGVRVAVSEFDPIPIILNNYHKEVIEKEGYSQYKGLIQAFDPIKYDYKYDSTPFEDVDQRYINMLPDNNSKDSFGFIPPGFTYKEITKWIDWRKELSTNKVYRDLELSADTISTNRDKGRSPILYSENENLREKADQNALELRLAAWFYIDNRYSPEDIKKSPQLLEAYQRLGNIVARALVKSPNPDDKKLGVLIRSRSNFNQTEK